MNVQIDIPDELVEAIAARVVELTGNPKASPLMTVSEAADYLRCQPKRIYDLTSQRRIDFVKDGSRTLVRREALDRYLSESCSR
ncbi:MAG: helix-turn-helix domain-containing protein [Solirubrobacterales bacterium]|nr:helix-turn-helix domain-containing protein [Solirubrobacterales bacterium]